MKRIGVVLLLLTLVISGGVAIVAADNGGDILAEPITGSVTVTDGSTYDTGNITVDSGDEINQYEINLTNMSGDVIVRVYDASNNEIKNTTYSSEGNFTTNINTTDETISIEIQDDAGLADSSTTVDNLDVIGDENNAPKITANDTSPAEIDEEVTITGNASDADNDNLSIDYDLDGDGAYEYTDAGESVNYSYSNNGTYDVVVRVQDEHGLSSTDNTTVEIGNTSSTTDDDDGGAVVYEDTSIIAILIGNKLYTVLMVFAIALVGIAVREEKMN